MGLFAVSNVLAVVMPDHLSLNNLVDGKQILDIETQKTEIDGLAYSAGGKLLAFGSSTHPSKPGLLRVYSLESKKEILSQQVTPAVRATAFDADGKWLAVAQGIWGYGKTIIYVRDVASGKVVAGEWRFPHRIDSLAFSRDGRFLFGGDYDGNVHVWNLSTGKEELMMRGHTSEVLAIAVSMDGRNLATGDAHGEIKLWDQETGQVRATFRGQGDAVSSICFSADNMTLSSIDSKGTIRHWRAK